MSIEDIIGIIITLLVPCGFAYVIVCSLFQPNNPESLRGERRKVEFEGENFEFRFWEDEYGMIWSGVFAPQPPRKVLWKQVNDDKCIAKTWGETDPVGWCFTQLEGFYANRVVTERGKEKLKKFLDEYPEL